MGWVVLIVIASFILSAFGAFDTNEDKERKREETKRNCKHKWGARDEYGSSGVHYIQYCSKCGESYVDRW